jgi:hypothetical protein
LFDWLSTGAGFGALTLVLSVGLMTAFVFDVLGSFVQVVCSVNLPADLAGMNMS